MLGLIFALHVSLWHLIYTSFLISVFCAHALMMIFTLIERVTVNCHLVWLPDTLDGMLVKGLCAHIATHDGRPTHSVCTASEWSGTEASFGCWPAWCCWWGRVLQGWHIQMGVRNETTAASELLLEHWECWFVAERGTCYLLSRGNLMLSQCMWLHGAPLFRGPWKKYLDFRFYTYSTLCICHICIARSGLRECRAPKFLYLHWT